MASIFLIKLIVALTLEPDPRTQAENHLVSGIMEARQSCLEQLAEEVSVAHIMNLIAKKHVRTVKAVTYAKVQVVDVVILVGEHFLRCFTRVVGVVVSDEDIFAIVDVNIFHANFQNVIMLGCFKMDMDNSGGITITRKVGDVVAEETQRR